MIASWGMVILAMTIIMVLVGIRNAMDQMFKRHLEMVSLLSAIEGRLEQTHEKLRAIEQHTHMSAHDHYAAERAALSEFDLG